ncbi:hypothetical protein EJ08DRAFT_194001 [Tothia fuscella]|uniref:Uncharacterized protein n=1 Tax=Tothia fuscella TaxID=1048955 RepID=A0A9P4TZ20_9PEZI|nr:hypothetical protein EJ08DRAFT_194001 [Tothia fuscella]
MPSHLRLQEDFEPISTGTIRLSSQPPQKKQKMSLTQTYYVASSARAKLGKEACRPDHNLRLLVGHANLLDSLMLELQDAEREQEAWFNSTIQKVQKSDEPKHIQWLDTIVQEDEEDLDDGASDASDSDSDFDGDDFEMLPLKRLRSPPVTMSSQTIAEEEGEDDIYEDDENLPELALIRTHSHSSPPPPPELDSDSENESDDESMPASPPQPTLDLAFFDEKHDTFSQSERDAFFDDGFFIPERNAPMIAAC